MLREDLTIDENAKEKLRAEAIKWIKELHKEERPYNIPVIQFIHRFFNITSEDLK